MPLFPEREPDSPPATPPRLERMQFFCLGVLTGVVSMVAYVHTSFVQNGDLEAAHFARMDDLAAAGYVRKDDLDLTAFARSSALEAVKNDLEAVDLPRACLLDNKQFANEQWKTRENCISWIESVEDAGKQGLRVHFREDAFSTLPVCNCTSETHYLCAVSQVSRDGVTVRQSLPWNLEDSVGGGKFFRAASVTCSVGTKARGEDSSQSGIRPAGG